MACRRVLAISWLLAVLGCGPGPLGETGGSDGGDGGDGDPGDGDPGDADSGDGDGDEGDPTGEPSECDTTGDGTGDGDGEGECSVLGFLMAPCDGVSGVCLDGWTCHFYDSVDIYGVSPVGNCSPPCDDDADCEFTGQFGGHCSDCEIVCAAYGPDDVRRCILPCNSDDECYHPHQYCDENLGLCLTNST